MQINQYYNSVAKQQLLPFLNYIYDSGIDISGVYRPLTPNDLSQLVIITGSGSTVVNNTTNNTTIGEISGGSIGITGNSRVFGSVNITGTSNIAVTGGNINLTNEVVTISPLSGYMATFGASGNINNISGSTVVIQNDGSFAGIAFTMTIPLSGEISFESTFDNFNWTSCTLRRTASDGYIRKTNVFYDSYIGSIAGARAFRVRVSQSGFNTGSIIGTLQKYVNTLEGIENGAPNDFETNLVEGKVAGYSIVNKFGRNSDIDTSSVPEDIWNGGGVYAGFPTGTTGETLVVFSNSASDTALGIGARTIRVAGLDQNYNSQTELFVLNGLTPVTGTKLFTRAHSASVLTAGSNDFNIGNISVRHSITTSNLFMFTPIGTNQSNVAGYTVPAGKTAYMRKIFGSIRGGTSATVDGSIWLREFGAAPRLRRPFSFSTNAQLNDVVYGGLVFNAKTDIQIRITSASVNNLDVTAGYDLILVDD